MVNNRTGRGSIYGSPYAKGKDTSTEAVERLYKNMIYRLDKKRKKIYRSKSKIHKAKKSKRNNKTIFDLSDNSERNINFKKGIVQKNTNNVKSQRTNIIQEVIKGKKMHIRIMKIGETYDGLVDVLVKNKSMDNKISVCTVDLNRKKIIKVEGI